MPSDLRIPRGRSTFTVAICIATGFVVALLFLSSPGSLVYAGTVTLQNDTVAEFNPGSFYHTGLTEDSRPTGASTGDGEVRLLNVGINSATWRSDGNTTGLPGTGVWGHAAAIIGDRIYLSGGNDGTLNGESGALSGVFMTTFQANHNLANWTSLTALPEARYSHGMAVVGNYVYVIGGIDQDFNVEATVYKALIQGNGTIGAWSTADPIPVSNSDIGLYDTTVAQLDGRIYVFGGHNSAGASLNTNFIGTQGANGEVTWVAASANLPDYLAELASTTSPNHIYLFGGVDNNGLTAEYSPNTYYVQPSAGGDIASWNQTAPMQRNLVRGSGTQFGEQVYVSGGSINTGGTPQNIIQSTLINESGSLALNWLDSEVLSQPRIQTASVMSDDGWLYVIEGGTGSNGRTPLTTIDYGPTTSGAAGIYALNGTYTSAPFDLLDARPILQLRWNASVFAQTTLGMQYKSANSLADLSNATWQPGTPIQSTSGLMQTNSSNLSGNARYFQYRATFSTTDETKTPILNWVELDYDAPATPTPTATATNQGGNTNTPTHTPTQTLTSTRTRTPTVTGTVCAGKPAKPTLASPNDGSQLKVNKLKLAWNAASCATAYKLIVREGGIKGPRIVTTGRLTKLEYKLKNLKKGEKYFWRVKAINSVGGIKSPWWDFKIRP